jgi:hypothetical protein
VLIFLAIVLGLVMCGESQAKTVGIHLATYHDRGDYNDRNPGIYARSAAGWTAGIYQNSLRKTSAHGGYTWSITNLLGDVSLTAGAVTGYTRPMTPLLVPSARVGCMRLSLLPKAAPKGATGLHLSIEF